jgi:hypothetical protein
MNPEQYVWRKTVIPSPYPIYAKDKRPGPSTNIPANLYGEAHPLFGTRQLAQKQLNEKIQKLLEDEKVVTAFKKAIVDKKEALNRAFRTVGTGPEDEETHRYDEELKRQAELQKEKRRQDRQNKEARKMKEQAEMSQKDFELEEFYDEHAPSIREALRSAKKRFGEGKKASQADIEKALASAKKRNSGSSPKSDSAKVQLDFGSPIAARTRSRSA